MMIKKNVFVFIFLLFGLSACQTSPVALSSYDPEIRNMLVRYSVVVDNFWQQMKMVPKEQRQFSRYASSYDEMSVNFKVLLKLNQLRDANAQSSKQSENLLTLWQKDQAKHQNDDGFKDFFIKRRITEYQRMFDAMIVAEDAKKM